MGRVGLCCLFLAGCGSATIAPIEHAQTAADLVDVRIVAVDPNVEFDETLNTLTRARDEVGPSPVVSKEMRVARGWGGFCDDMDWEARRGPFSIR